MRRGLRRRRFRFQDAIDRVSGQRNYSHSVSLEQNLKGIIRSTIWNVNKSSRHKGITDLPEPEAQDTHDPISELPGASPPPDALAIGSETLRERERMLREFEKSLAGEDELLKLVSDLKLNITLRATWNGLWEFQQPAYLNLSENYGNEWSDSKHTVAEECLWSRNPFSTNP